MLPVRISYSLTPCAVSLGKLLSQAMKRSGYADLPLHRGHVPFARTYRSFPVPHAFFMPLLAVCQGVHRLAVLARFARWIPDTPDAVDDCIESGANGGGTPGGGPPTTRPALAAAAYPAPARSTTNCLPRRPRETRWRSTEYVATSSCFRARPRQSEAPGRSLRHSCGACCVSG